MREYFTEAVVLHKEPAGEKDEKVVLYTEALGKITARITSGRKITSKLSPHLEPLNLVNVRLIKKNIFQIGDALKIEKSQASLAIARLLKAMTLEGTNDPEVWAELKKSSVSLTELLRILGFEYELGPCHNCGVRPIAYFVFRDARFLCRECATPSTRPTERVFLEAVS